MYYCARSVVFKVIETISFSKHFACVRGVTLEGWQLCQISVTCEIVLRNNLLILTKD